MLPFIGKTDHLHKVRLHQTDDLSRGGFLALTLSITAQRLRTALGILYPNQPGSTHYLCSSHGSNIGPSGVAVADPDVDDPDEENSQDVPVLDVSDGSDEFEPIVGDCDSYEEQVLPARIHLVANGESSHSPPSSF